MEDVLLTVLCAFSEACLEAVLENAAEIVVLIADAFATPNRSSARHL